VVNTIHPIEGELWNIKDIKKIDFEVTDTVNGYNFFLLVRNNNDYAYRNLHLFVNLTFPNNKVSKDTLHIDLASKEGRWLGKGVGSQYNSEILFKKDQRFPFAGNYNISIEQAMRETDIPGITDIGISIRKNN